LAKSNVGSSYGIVLDDGTNLCFLLSKKLIKAARAVSDVHSEVSWAEVDVEFGVEEFSDFYLNKNII